MESLFLENNDENEYLEVESGYMTLAFSVKTIKSKNNPKYIEFMQGLLGSSSNKKVKYNIYKENLLNLVYRR